MCCKKTKRNRKARIEVTSETFYSNSKRFGRTRKSIRVNPKYISGNKANFYGRVIDAGKLGGVLIFLPGVNVIRLKDDK